MRPFAQVGPDGKFAASTYTQGDGLPAGSYVMTVEWRAFNAIANASTGPDKLNEAYADPTTSDLRVTVVDGPVEIPRLDLQIKPGPANKKRTKR